MKYFVAFSDQGHTFFSELEVCSLKSFIPLVRHEAFAQRPITTEPEGDAEDAHADSTVARAMAAGSAERTLGARFFRGARAARAEASVDTEASVDPSASKLLPDGSEASVDKSADELFAAAQSYSSLRFPLF